MQEAETWDIYDVNRSRTGRIHPRGEPLPPGTYHLVVHVWVQNGRGEFLITRRAPEKSWPLLWECTGGSALAGEDSLTAALREAKEETGFALLPENGARVFAVRREDTFCDVWLFRQDVALADFVPQPGETTEARLAAPEEILRMMDAGTFFRHSFTGALLGLAMEERAVLLQREKLLICPPPGTDRAEIENLLARDFVEIASSGRICTCDEGIEALLHRAEYPPGPWKIAAYELRRLSESICLASYVLTWDARSARRTTIWRREEAQWRAVHHQGTMQAAILERKNV